MHIIIVSNMIYNIYCGGEGQRTWTTTQTTGAMWNMGHIGDDRLLGLYLPLEA